MFKFMTAKMLTRGAYLLMETLRSMDVCFSPWPLSTTSSSFLKTKSGLELTM